MTLPTFLGLGAMRSGSTWLDNLLRCHPQVFLPRDTKEIHFLDRYYDRGWDWYRSHFPTGEEAAAFRHFGEITPKYLHLPGAPEILREHLPHCQFLIILRNPADRAYSHYCQLVQHRGVSRTFRGQLEALPEIVDRGFYARQIERYFEWFPPEQFCIFIFERATRAPREVARRLADFLALDESGFASQENGAASKKVNASSVPRFPRTYLAGKALARLLRHCGQSWAVRAAAGLGLRAFFRDGKPVPPLDPATRRELLDLYESDMRQLESLLGIDLSLWRDRPARQAA